MAAKLILEIAWTHVTARVRQTLVGMAGVAVGVGFTIIMAGLVQGSPIAVLRQPRPGIRYPETVMASLRSWIPGDVAPSVRPSAIIDHGGGRIGVTLTGIDPRLEARVSKLPSQMREGQITD